MWEYPACTARKIKDPIFKNIIAITNKGIDTGILSRSVAVNLIEDGKEGGRKFR